MRIAIGVVMLVFAALGIVVSLAAPWLGKASLMVPIGLLLPDHDIERKQRPVLFWCAIAMNLAFFVFIGLVGMAIA